MSLARCLRVPIVWISMVLLTASAGEAGLQRDPVGESAPTAIEQAVIDHVCRGTLAMAGAEAHEECLSVQLLSLRADFGRDLRRLSNAERQTIDAACSTSRTDRGRDTYVACLHAELVSVRSRRKGAKPARPAQAPSPTELPPESLEEVVSADGVLPETPPATSWATFVWIGVAAMSVVIVAAGGLLLTKKNRRRAVACRTCGASFSEPGDLCPTCRHEAADALRRAAAERVELARAKDEEARRQREQEEEQRLQNTRREEKARQDEQERTRQQEEARREEARQREEDAKRRERERDAAEVFDPYEVLGVARDAGAESIQAAYQAAKAKYAEDQLEYLGVELQERFRQKAQAVERAHQMLTQ